MLIQKRKNIYNSNKSTTRPSGQGKAKLDSSDKNSRFADTDKWWASELFDRMYTQEMYLPTLNNIYHCQLPSRPIVNPLQLAILHKQSMSY